MTTAARGLVELLEDESLALAASAQVGRLAHVQDGRVSLTPVNVRVHGRSALVRTEPGTELLAAATAGTRAVLEVDDLVEWSHSGWSVLLRGVLSEVTDPRLVREALDDGPQPWAGPGRERVVLLTVDEVSGRRVVPGPGAVTVLAGLPRQA